MGKFTIWLWRALLGVFLFMTGVGPEGAKSNISAWLDRLGLDQAAAATSDFIVDPALLWALALLIAVSFIPNMIEAAGKSGLVPERIPTSRQLAIAADKALAKYTLAEHPGWDGSRKIGTYIHS